MAKAKEAETSQAVVAQSDALPAYLQDYSGPMGGEGIDADDITIPRLKLAHAISDEVKSGAMPEGAMFLNVTQQPLWQPGQPPLLALILAVSKEYCLWRPRKDGDGGLLARAQPVRENGVVRYRWDKPNTDFDVKVDGKVKVTWTTKRYIDEDHLADWGTEIPGNSESGAAATAHHNYLLMLPEHNAAVVALSLTRTGVKVAKALNALIKMGPPRVPLAVRLWAITSVEETSGGGDKFMNYKIVPAGVLGNDRAALARQALEMARTMAERGFVVDQATPAAPAQQTEGDDIPF